MAKGIRITQAGIPVDRAADYQKTLDERWPILEFLFMGILDLKNVSSNILGARDNSFGSIAYVPIYKHNLGYLPGFMARNISYTGPDLGGNVVENMLFADTQYIYLMIFKDAPISVFSLKIWLGVIDRDLNQDFSSPVDIVTSTMTASASAFGLKVLNNPVTTGMNENRKEVYTANTNAKSMAIQAHGVRPVDGTGKLIVRHGLGYPPSYMLAKKEATTSLANHLGDVDLIRALAWGSYLAKADAINLTMFGGQTNLVGTFMFIILKDPVDVAK